MRARNAREDRSRTPMISALVAAKYILMLCVAIVVGLSTYVCFGISVARLVQRDYGDAGGDAANKAKLEAALDIFYALVLIQTAFRIYWAVLGSQDLCTPVSDECGFAGWGPKLVRRYEADTQISCNKEEPLPRGWNLITYAVVLLESASLDDRLSGARVLDTFVEQGILVRKELLSSSPYEDLLTTQFPGTLRCVCSLLEASIEQTLDLKSSSVASQASDLGGVHLSLAIPEQTDHQQQQLERKVPWYGRVIDILFDKEPDFRHGHTFVSKGTKELISQGLLILERLTQDQDNCTAICNHPRLLSKITSSITTHQDFGNNAYDRTWVEMLSRSLTVMRRLITSPGDEAAKLCHGISCNPVAVRNLIDILESDNKGAKELREQSLEILTELALEDSFRQQPFDEFGTATSIMEEFTSYRFCYTSCLRMRTAVVQ
nr:uncharacterized protein LOC127315976 [Lolium perenne]